MDSWIKNLWNKNKILFFVLIPLIVIVLFKDLLIGLLGHSIRKEANKARKEDKDLKAKADAANKKADSLKAEADGAEDRIKNKDSGLDWHEK